MAIVQSDRKTYVYYQKPVKKNSEYIKEFKSLMAVSDIYDGNLGEHKGLMAQLLKTEGTTVAGADTATLKAAMEKTKLAYRACMALNASNNLQYKQLKNYLDNQF